MNEGMENIKTIESLEEENLKLKKEIDRLNEEYQLLEIIEKDHKELIDKVHEFFRPTKRSIDDL